MPDERELPSPSEFSDRVALISGGAQGIGRAIVERLQRERARVAFIDCDIEAGRATADELSQGRSANPVTFVPCNLLKPEEIRQATDVVHEKFGRVDILVNNAGIEIDKPFAEISLADWDRVLGVNLRGAFLLSQCALPLFGSGGGSIVNISSIHSSHAFPNALAYACSKAGMIALTRNLALELAPASIRVNAICPGYIDTRLWEEYVRHVPNPAELSQQVADLHPLGRRGLPDDVAEVVLFFAGSRSNFITGTTIVVDGGLTVRAHP
ncbi:MAG: SDR family NAD(P)-dependent oxidoreductase [Acidobacteriaceae bacterium]